MTTRRRFLRISRDLAIGLGTGALVTLPAGCEEDERRTVPPDPADPRPNIILFVVDDLGVTDCGHCGSTFYRTPAMDRMAREGLRFTQAYSPSPLCSSSRAAIHTGKYPQRLGITGAIACVSATPCEKIDRPYLRGGSLPWQKVVPPTFLTQLPLGERTLAEYLRDAGYATAHVGKWHLGSDEYSAAAQGFTHVVGGGVEFAASTYFSPYNLGNFPDGAPGEYITDRLTAESKAYIRAHRNEPFFLSIGHYGVHMPLQAPADLADEYRALRTPGAAQRNPVYAAMLERVDASLGDLLQALDAMELSARTLVIVTSDNGGYMQVAHEQYLMRVTSNGPFRNGKASLYEGGIRVPLLLRGAGVIAGATSDVPVSGIDILPTVLAFAGQAPVSAVDGQNLLPLIDAGTVPPPRPLFWHHPHYSPIRTSNSIERDEHAHTSLPTSVVRRGDFKLVRIYGEGVDRAAVDELYDLAVDPGELNNMAASEPARVSELGALLSAHLAEAGALVPIPNPLYRERLDGWRIDKDCVAHMAHGYLHLTATGPKPRLVSAALRLDETCVCRLRMRCASATTVSLDFSTHAGERVFDAGDTVSVVVAAGTEFVDVDFTVPVVSGTPVVWLRLGSGRRGDVVDIDAIRLFASAEPARTFYEWTFNGVSGLRYGGSWFSATDTFVACGPGSLQIDMPGDSPAIMSPLVTLFGHVRLRIRMRSTGAGPCALAWSVTPVFEPRPARVTEFPVPHDGAWHEHEVLLEEKSDNGIQRMVLSLGNASGIAEIDYIRAFDAQDSLIAVWDFCDGQPS